MCLFREPIIHSAGTCDGGYSTLRNCKENKNAPVVHSRTFLSRGEERFLQGNMDTFREGEKCKATKNQKDESDGAKSEQRRSAVSQLSPKKSQKFWVSGLGWEGNKGRTEWITPREPHGGRLGRLYTCHFLFTGLRFSVTTIFLNVMEKRGEAMWCHRHARPGATALRLRWLTSNLSWPEQLKLIRTRNGEKYKSVPFTVTG